LTEKILPIHVSVWVDSSDAEKLGMKRDKNHRLSKTLNLIFPFGDQREAFERIKTIYETIASLYREELRKKS
jgi:hypothetical protein